MPWCLTTDEPPLALLLKSGNFGDRDLFGPRHAGSRLVSDGDGPRGRSSRLGRVAASTAA